MTGGISVGTSRCCVHASGRAVAFGVSCTACDGADVACGYCEAKGRAVAPRPSRWGVLRIASTTTPTARPCVARPRRGPDGRPSGSSPAKASCKPRGSSPTTAGAPDAANRDPSARSFLGWKEKDPVRPVCTDGVHQSPSAHAQPKRLWPARHRQEEKPTGCDRRRTLDPPSGREVRCCSFPNARTVPPHWRADKSFNLLSQSDLRRIANRAGWRRCRAQFANFGDPVALICRNLLRHSGIVNYRWIRRYRSSSRGVNPYFLIL